VIDGALEGSEKRRGLKMAVSEKGHLRISNISNEIEQIKQQSNGILIILDGSQIL